MAIKAYKYRIYPNKTQEREFEDLLNQGRLLWNLMLDYIFTAYRLTRESETPLTERDAMRDSRLLKFTQWMVRRYPTYGKLEPNDNVKYMYDSVKEAFAKWRSVRKPEKMSKGRPHFKKAEHAAGLTFRAGFHLIDPETGETASIGRNGSATRKSAFTEFTKPLKGRYLYISGWGGYTFPSSLVRIHLHRPLPSGVKIQNVQLIREKQQWYIVLTFKDDFEPALLDGAHGVGIDVGLKYIVADTTGMEPIPHQKWLKNMMPRYQALSQTYQRRQRKNNPDNYDERGRVKRGVTLEWHESGNMQRTKVEMRNLHRRISNQRAHFWNEYVDMLTHPEKCGYSLIAIEDMNATWMRGKPEIRRLSADAGLGMFRLKLANKCAERGVMLIRVTPAYTSQTCHECGHVARENRVERDWFCCVACGHEEDADLHAAKNILRKAYADCDTVYQFLAGHGDSLREMLEASPRKQQSLAKQTAKTLGVRHWTTVTQVAERMAVGL